VEDDGGDVAGGGGDDEDDHDPGQVDEVGAGDPVFLLLGDSRLRPLGATAELGATPEGLWNGGWRPAPGEEPMVPGVASPWPPVTSSKTPRAIAKKGSAASTTPTDASKRADRCVWFFSSPSGFCQERLRLRPRLTPCNARFSQAGGEAY
jgi:hypothetical protein